MAAPVTLEDPGHMNLLGLLLRDFLGHRLGDPRQARRAARLRGRFGLQAGDMAVTLGFGPEGVTIAKGLAPGTRARLSGPLGVMVRLVTAGSLVTALVAVLLLRVRIRGNPFALLGLLPLMLGRPRAGSTPGDA